MSNETPAESGIAEKTVQASAPKRLSKKAEPADNDEVHSDPDGAARIAPEAANPKSSKRQSDPIRKWTVFILLVLALLLALQITSDRIAPVTSKSTVEGLIIPIAPQVSGEISAVHIADNQIVDAAAPLFDLDPVSFQLAVDAAQAQLEVAGQTIGASTEQVAAAEAKLAEARAELVNVRAQAERVLTLVKKGAYAKARGDKAESELAQSEADVQAAEAELREAQQSLGPTGENNPQLRAASAQLGIAQFNLSKTKIVAPAQGYISNLRVGVGSAAQSGKPIATLIDLDGAWVVAFFRENQIANIKQGDPVEIILETRPGEVLRARVADWGAGVMTINQDAPTGELVQLPSSGNWLTQPQRFPVRIEFDPPDEFPRPIRLGTQVTVMVYTAKSAPLDPLWRLYMRAVSWLTYVY